MLHLRAEVSYACAVEVLDLGQCGAGNDVAAFMESTLLLWTVFHLGQCTWKNVEERGRERVKIGKMERWRQIQKVVTSIESESKSGTSKLYIIRKIAKYYVWC